MDFFSLFGVLFFKFLSGYTQLTSGMFKIPLAELIISNNFAFPFKIGRQQELEN
ncbi:MAG: hypothetical protein RLZ13_691 [Bacteroidota bacterium]|jgi:hypothetical protein